MTLSKGYWDKPALSFVKVIFLHSVLSFGFEYSSCRKGHIFQLWPASLAESCIICTCGMGRYKLPSLLMHHVIHLCFPYSCCLVYFFYYFLFYRKRNKQGKFRIFSTRYKTPMIYWWLESCEKYSIRRWWAEGRSISLRQVG